LDQKDQESQKVSKDIDVQKLRVRNWQLDSVRKNVTFGEKLLKVMVLF